MQRISIIKSLIRTQKVLCHNLIRHESTVAGTNSFTLEKNKRIETRKILNEKFKRIDKICRNDLLDAVAKYDTHAITRKWFAKSLEHNVVNGKLLWEATIAMIEALEVTDKEILRLGNILGWCASLVILNTTI